jgi:predicted enzyme related to lactoylglutathione lyase
MREGGAMSEIGRIVDQMRKSWGGGAWRGPSLSELLAGVDAAKASAHPVAGHSLGAPTSGICHVWGENAGLPPQWLPYIRVSELDGGLEKCAARGGRLVAGPSSFGEGRRYAVIEDPAGAVAAIYEEKEGS